MAAEKKKPGKKAAKKVAKKAAKHGGKHGQGEDMRRAYEHLHRVGLLHASLGREDQAQVDALSSMARGALSGKDAESAADLLRAAEHFAFGSLALRVHDRNLKEELAEAAQSHFEHLVDRATDRWKKHARNEQADLAALYHAMSEAADEAYRAGAWHRALEFARGAEALTHVHSLPQPKLEQGSKHKRLGR